MRDILQKIAIDKRLEIELLKAELPQEKLERMVTPLTGQPFHKALTTGNDVHIIAELKRGSPSKGIIAPDFNPVVLAQNYRDGGASALSVLTEQKYFFGRPEYIKLVKDVTHLPVLCKDFIIDKYQIYHARYMQADAILLIVRLLPPDTIKKFIDIATSIGMSCLVETHNADEVTTAVDCGAEIIGVNNRDLNDFSVSLETCEKLSLLIPDTIVKVAESGIFSHEDITRLQQSGYNCFLIGEALMTAEKPVALLQSLRGIL